MSNESEYKMSNESEYQINILINSMKLINMYIDKLKNIYTPKEKYYNIYECSSCNSLIKLYSDSRKYIYKCNYGCNCDTNYCQIEYIFNRSEIDHDEMCDIVKKIIRQTDIRNDIVKNINMSHNKDSRLRYCKRCDNIINISYF
jgi:hypothetical protein